MWSFLCLCENCILPAHIGKVLVRSLHHHCCIIRGYTVYTFPGLYRTRSIKKNTPTCRLLIICTAPVVGRITWNAKF